MKMKRLLADKPCTKVIQSDSEISSTESGLWIEIVIIDRRSSSSPLVSPQRISMEPTSGLGQTLHSWTVENSMLPSTSMHIKPWQGICQASPRHATICCETLTCHSITFRNREDSQHLEHQEESLASLALGLDPMAVGLHVCQCGTMCCE